VFIISLHSQLHPCDSHTILNYPFYQLYFSNFCTVFLDLPPWITWVFFWTILALDYLMGSWEFFESNSEILKFFLGVMFLLPYMKSGFEVLYCIRTIVDFSLSTKFVFKELHRFSFEYYWHVFLFSISHYLVIVHIPMYVVHLSLSLPPPLHTCTYKKSSETNQLKVLE
jgi:hypothetical protein